MRLKKRKKTTDMIKRAHFYFNLYNIFDIKFGTHLYLDRFKFEMLNTDFPLVGNCIELHKSEWWTWTNTLNAFSTMVWSLMSIVTSLILIICFIMLIMAWIKRSSNDPKAARDLIKKVAITVLLLWLSGVILKVINPTFFW